MKKFGGKVLVLERNDINTDEIIPAKYLTEISKETLQPHLLEDLKLPGFAPSGVKFKQGGVVLTLNNFGCGSSREHAPWAFEVNNINAIVAIGFARIFKQNMLNCGMLPVVLSEKEIKEMIKLALPGRATINFNLSKKILTLKVGSKSRSYGFELDLFAEKLIKSGGWVNYANSVY